MLMALMFAGRAAAMGVGAAINKFEEHQELQRRAYEASVRAARALVEDYPKRGTFDEFEAAVALVKEAEEREAQAERRAEERRRQQEERAERLSVTAAERAERAAVKAEVERQRDAEAELVRAREAEAAAAEKREDAITEARETLDRARFSAVDALTLKHAHAVLKHYGAA